MLSMQVDLDKNVLTLSISHEEKKEAGNDLPEGSDAGAAAEADTCEAAKASEGKPTWHRSERSRWFVQRKVTLPECADTSTAEASYSDGVLTIKFPKRSAPPSTRLTIQ